MKTHPTHPAYAILSGRRKKCSRSMSNLSRGTLSRGQNTCQNINFVVVDKECKVNFARRLHSFGGIKGLIAENLLYPREGMTS